MLLNLNQLICIGKVRVRRCDVVDVEMMRRMSCRGIKSFERIRLKLLGALWSTVATWGKLQRGLTRESYHWSPLLANDDDDDDFFFFIGQVLDLPNTGNHTQHITCTIRLEIALS